jgi:hypothetical protein
VIRALVVAVALFGGEEQSGCDLISDRLIGEGCFTPLVEGVGIVDLSVDQEKFGLPGRQFFYLRAVQGRHGNQESGVPPRVEDAPAIAYGCVAATTPLRFGSPISDEPVVNVVRWRLARIRDNDLDAVAQPLNLRWVQVRSQLLPGRSSHEAKRQPCCDALREGAQGDKGRKTITIALIFAGLLGYATAFSDNRPRRVLGWSVAAAACALLLWRLL